MKNNTLILGGLAVVVLLVGVLYVTQGHDTVSAPAPEPVTVITENQTPPEAQTQVPENSGRSVVPEATYTVNGEESTVTWAGRKTLVDGYINKGSLAVERGTIQVEGDAATGEFIIDMQSLSVSDTPKKPGQESLLEEHLKGEKWFDATTYPTATFTILEVTKRADSDQTFMYDVRGSLAMKGETHELTFPATIYQDTTTGAVVAEASLSFDRTKWGITAGSGSFFDNLADNVIDDMVDLSFSVTAYAPASTE